ncbi:A24 family peptidase [Cupriavidus sp. BIC8F]|uniref:A24 family peptidase n=1 Tax=Cupriavidus sp. BIC8F TaxID=3079014 RepID=UPI002916BC42|nr:prepilin peptidase [Cupriavidus sp. BIC8F]
MHPFSPATTFCLLAMVGIAAISDLRSRRIPNWLVVAGLLVSLVLQISQLGAASGAWTWLTGALAGLVPFVVLYLMRALGAGDAKLMAAIGAFVGPQPLLYIMLVTFLAGGVMALVMIAIFRSPRQALASISVMLMSLPFGVTSVHTAGEDKTPGSRLPYAVPIAAGVLLVATDML